MKQPLLTFSSLLLATTLFAQQNVTPVKKGPEFDVAYPSPTEAYTGLEYHAAQPEANAQKPTAAVQSKAYSEEIIGETFYDLMTNSSVQNRTIRHANGTTAAAWTGALDPDPYNDRGSFYNYADASQTWGAFPSTRIESLRTGWPSLLTTDGGTEFVISHSGVGCFTYNWRSTVGSGAWTEATLPTATGQNFLWPRATAGGADGNSIHVIGITTPTGNNGTLYNNMDGALLYWRSQDQGQTWDVQDLQIPGLDSLEYSGTRADAYTIVAEGDVIAIVMFGQWSDITLAKSTDNGDTWNITTINDFPLDFYVTDTGSDIDGDNIYDTITTSDESGAALIDGNGMVHVTYGNMRVLDADLTDGNTSYFPGTSGLMYWNENMSTGGAVMIADVEDIDGDGELTWAGDWALYFTSLTSHPSMGKNADGTIFISYSGYKELHTTGTQNYRHIHMMKSNDNGSTWTTPVDVTPDYSFDGLECMFASMAPMVDDKVRIVYMRDFEPGLAVRGDMDFSGVNEMIYLCIDTLLPANVSINDLEAMETPLSLYPNPAQQQATLEFELQKGSSATITIYDFLGQEVETVWNGTLPAGTQRFNLDLNALSEGVYFITLQEGELTSTARLVITK